MNKTFTICVIAMLVFASSVSAQPWQSIFGKDSTVWTRMVSGPSTLDPIYTARFYVEKDTILRASRYKKVSNSLPPHMLNRYLLREVLDSGKVYCVELKTIPQDPTAPCRHGEFLYMDYNLKKGDTFFHYPPPYEQEGVVDTTFIENGRKHIVFAQKFPDSLNERYTMIEGIGFNFNIGNNFPCVYDRAPSASFLFCNWKDNVQQYATPRFNNNCYPYPIYVTGIKEPAKSLYAIYPNPTSTAINIVFDNALIANTQYHIYDALGRLIQQSDIQAGAQKVNIDIANHPSGIYCLVIDNQKFLFTKQ